MSKKTIIIGSGFGALGAAIRLSARGFDVEIFDLEMGLFCSFKHAYSPIALLQMISNTSNNTSDSWQLCTFQYGII